jgi:hypothetical protein
MEAKWPDFAFEKRGSGALVWRGPLRPKMRTYNVQVYWHAPNFALPYVCVIDPKLKPRPGVGFDAIPHLLFDAADPEWSGLCLFDPAGKEWDPSKLIADTTIYWAAEWLLYYELWHLTGKWLGPSVGPESVAAMLQAKAQKDEEANLDVH